MRAGLPDPRLGSEAGNAPATRAGPEAAPEAGKPGSGERRMRLRWGLAALAFAATFGVGFMLAREFAPERLRLDAEIRLAEALGGGPVSIGRLHLAPGLGLRLLAESVTAWPSEAGPRLRVERIEAKLRPFAFLTGGPTLGSLVLDGAVLSLARSRTV